MLCLTILKSGKRVGEPCNRKMPCSYHKGKSKELTAQRKNKKEQANIDHITKLIIYHPTANLNQAVTTIAKALHVGSYYYDTIKYLQANAINRLELLPTELLLVIAEKCTLLELILLPLVSKNWYSLLKNNNLLIKSTNVLYYCMRATFEDLIYYELLKKLYHWGAPVNTLAIQYMYTSCNPTEYKGELLFAAPITPHLKAVLALEDPDDLKIVVYNFLSKCNI